MNKHLSALTVSLLAGALVACRLQTLESVARDPEGLVLTYLSTEVDETGSWDVIQIENPTATTFQFPGTGPESPSWFHSVETDHGWLRSAGNWCGTGILGNPVAPGASLVLRARTCGPSQVTRAPMWSFRPRASSNTLGGCARASA